MSSRNDANKPVHQSALPLLRSADFRELRDRQVIPLLTKSYHGQLSALHMPCSKVTRQREALSPHHRAEGSPQWLEEGTGMSVTRQERWLCRVVFCRCEYPFLSARWRVCPEDLHFTLSQGCWPLESNFPMEKINEQILYLKDCLLSFFVFLIFTYMCNVNGVGCIDERIINQTLQ